LVILIRRSFFNFAYETVSKIKLKKELILAVFTDNTEISQNAEYAENSNQITDIRTKLSQSAPSFILILV
jgi:hypothetical protein